MVPHEYFSDDIDLIILQLPGCNADYNMREQILIHLIVHQAFFYPCLISKEKFVHPDIFDAGIVKGEYQKTE